jgi:hypothetical protein
MIQFEYRKLFAYSQTLDGAAGKGPMTARPIPIIFLLLLG